MFFVPGLVFAAGLALLFADGVRGCAHGRQRIVDPMLQLVLTVPPVWRSCSCEIGQPCTVLTHSVLDHATGLTVVIFSAWCGSVRQRVLHHEARLASDHARVKS